MNKRYIFSFFWLSVEVRQFFREKYGYFRKKQLLRLFDGSRSPLSLYKVGLRLEMHLNRILVNSSMVPSYASARQLVSHGHVFVNGNAVFTTTYEVKMGDTISLNTFSGRQIVNKYWLEAIEKLFTDKLHLRNFSIKNISDKKNAMIPLYHDGGFKLDRWRSEFASVDQKYRRPAFVYGSINYKNSSSPYIDSISKRYDGWYYCDFQRRWFPPFFIKKRNKKLNLVAKKLSKEEILAKKKKRDKMLWSLNLAKQNKIRDGYWVKPSVKGLQVLLKNTHNVLFLNKKHMKLTSSEKLFKDISLSYDFLPKSQPLRRLLNLNISFHDKRYKKLSLYLKRKSRPVFRRFRLNSNVDGFDSFLFSGKYSSRWLSFSKIVKGVSSNVHFMKHANSVKGQFKRLSPIVPTNHLSKSDYFSYFKTKCKFFDTRSLKSLSKYPYLFKFRVTKNSKSTGTVYRFPKSLDSKRETQKKARFKGKSSKCKSQLNNNNFFFDTSYLSSNLSLDVRKKFYPKVFNYSQGSVETKNLKSLDSKFGSLYSRLSNVNSLHDEDFLNVHFRRSYKALVDLSSNSVGCVVPGPVQYNDEISYNYSQSMSSGKNMISYRIHLFRKLLKIIKRPNDHLLHKSYYLYRSSVFSDFMSICDLYARLKSDSDKGDVLSSLPASFRRFSLFRSRLGYFGDRKVISRSFLIKAFKGKKVLSKALTRKVSSSIPDSNSMVKLLNDSSFYYKWKYNNLLRIKHIIKWYPKYKKISYRNQFVYEKTDLRTIMYNVRYRQFVSLLRRSSRIPLDFFGKGHPLKPVSKLFSADKKKESIRKRFFDKTRLRSYQGFINWKNRFRYWYRNRSRNEFEYKASVSNKYSFSLLHKKKYFTLYSNPLGNNLRYKFFSNLYFLGRVAQVQNDFLFKLPSKFLEVDPKQLSVSVIRYPYSTELFKDIPVKVPRNVLGMFFRPKH